MTYVPRIAASIRAFKHRYDNDDDVREMFDDADHLAVLVTKYAEAEFADADPERYKAFDMFGHGEHPEVVVMGLIMMLTALEQTPKLMPLIVGRLLAKLQAAFEPDDQQ